MGHARKFIRAELLVKENVQLPVPQMKNSSTNELFSKLTRVDTL